ncbi:thiol_BshB1, bacillithiol biosynthesis deacetylase BshB1 [Burkholderiaceae bacterium]
MHKISKIKDSKKVVLVIVAHTDDETIGIGGAIAKHVESGDTVYGISMTNGVGARDGNNLSKIKSRYQASENAGKILGLTWLDNGNYPDNLMDTIPLIDVIKFIEKIKSKITPEIIYTHTSADLNIDHQIVSRATLTAFRPEPNEVWSEIRAFEVASSTDYGHRSITNLFAPNLFVDVTKTWNKKLAALKEYQSEIREQPHSRSIVGIENLAKHRGNQVGVYYAEAFEIIRKIER